MSHEKIKNLFQEAVASVASNIFHYSVRPQKDFSANLLSHRKNIMFAKDIPQKAFTVCI